MTVRIIFLLGGLLVSVGYAAPPAPAPGDLYGWELPRLAAVDTIKFPKRLVRNRSYGRVVAEINLRRDGSQQGTNYTFVENGDLTRWVDKILASARFEPARLDGSPVACKLPVHVVFRPKNGGQQPRYEVWLPDDQASYSRALQDHFLAANEGLPPLLLRVGSYGLAPGTLDVNGAAIFEVFVNKDGSREEGRLVQSPGDEFVREALSAMVDMQVLPPRYRRFTYGCWIRIIVGFYTDWPYPTRVVNRTFAPYRGWPAPAIAPVSASISIPPRLRGVNVPDSSNTETLLMRAGDIVRGHALFCAHVDTLGQVTEWFKARSVDRTILATDFAYSRYSPTAELPAVDEYALLSLPDLAFLAAAELERVIEQLRFLPARDLQGLKVDAWVALTPANFR